MFLRFLIFILPLVVNIVPFLAFLVGITQSNISIPISIAVKIFSGVPTPIKYLGLSAGMIPVECCIISYILKAGSPTANPPIAYPSKFMSINDSMHSRRRSLYVLPWPIPKRN